MPHKHRAVLSRRKEEVWTYCITPMECSANPERTRAHGGIHIVDVCVCGAVRHGEQNGDRVNYDGWLTEDE